MEKLFLSVLNMSLTASYVIIFVMLVRLPLKKAPKVISYALWCVVAFRLLCPFSFESMFSLIPTSTTPIPQDIAYQQNPQINSGITAVDTYINRALPSSSVAASVNSLQIYTQIGAYIWIFGIAAILIYSIVSVLILKRHLKSAQQVEQNIYEDDNLKTPFVLGIFRPRIYIPTGLTAEEKSYIIRHEQTHIHRFDHIVKTFAFLVLSIHWFNPLVWIAFVLMSTDMELSCDETVIRKMGGEIKKAYSESLLSLASGKRIINGSPLAFGEGNVKGRIKNVLNYKKPAFWIIVVAIIAVVAVEVGLMTNPKGNDSNSQSKTFEAVVIKNNGTSLIVYRNTDTENLFSVGLAEPALVGKNRETIEKNDIQSGQLIQIAYSGEILTVYPAIISKCYKISVLGQASKELFDKASNEYSQFNARDSNDSLVGLLVSGKKTNIQSINDVPNVTEYKKTKVNGEVYYVYEKDRKYYVEKPYQSMDEITKETYDKIIEAVSSDSIVNAMEPPKMAITIDGTEINYVVGLNQWNGSAYDRSDTFQTIMKGKSRADISYILLNKEFQIEFKDTAPDSVKLQDHILDMNGNVKYTEKEIRTIPIKFKNEKGSFTLTAHPAALLSSDSSDYEQGASIRGFRLTCKWGKNECEYAFVIRSDAR